MPTVKPGIYLEKKEGVIGTGHTAKSAEYRFFWMTLPQEGEIVKCLLLDQDFNPTGIQDTKQSSDFESDTIVYIPQGDKKYNLLLKKLLAQGKTAPAKKAPAAAAGKQKAEPDSKASPKWWEQSEKKIEPGDIFGRKEEDKKKGQTKIQDKKNWWES